MVLQKFAGFMQHSGFEVDIGAYYAVEAWLEAGGTEASHQG